MQDGQPVLIYLQHSLLATILHNTVDFPSYSLARNTNFRSWIDTLQVDKELDQSSEAKRCKLTKLFVRIRVHSVSLEG